MTLKQRSSSIAHSSHYYGKSLLGYPLEVFLPSIHQPTGLILAAKHGDEPETTAILSAALRSITPDELRYAVILAANPDGVLRGTRANARGVDLNRNFPTSDWSSNPVFHPGLGDEPISVELSTGSEPASEPETQALLDLVSNLTPQVIISLHARLGCIDDLRDSELGRWIAKETELPLVTDIGYPTPGSFGTWARENDISLITFEFPDESIGLVRKKFVPILCSLLINERSKV